MQPQHECTVVDGGFRLMAACDGEGLSTGGIVGVSVGVLIALVAVGFGIWWLIQKRRYS